MSARRGFSLVLVLGCCVLVSLCMTAVSLSVQWARLSAETEERRLRERMEAASMIREGRRWLENEIAAGRLPRAERRRIAANFAETRIRRVETGSSALDIHDLYYDWAPGGVPAGNWSRAKGLERFFPPGQGLFLLRAFRRETPGRKIMTEVVLRAVRSGESGERWALERRPVLWQEVWP